MVGDISLAIISMFEALKGRSGFYNAVTYYGMLYCLFGDEFSFARISTFPLYERWAQLFYEDMCNVNNE